MDGRRGQESDSVVDRTSHLGGRGAFQKCEGCVCSECRRKTVQATSFLSEKKFTQIQFIPQFAISQWWNIACPGISSPTYIS